MKTTRMRNKLEIRLEIKALKKLKPIGEFKNKTSATIARAIDELEGRGFDITCEEFNELPDHERDMIQQTLDWMDGTIIANPSKGWEGLVE